MIVAYLLLACWSNPTPTLPQSRLPVPLDGRLVRYGKLRGYLIQSPQPQNAYIWQVEKLEKYIQQCAHNHVPAQSVVLLIDQPTSKLAQEYVGKWVKGTIQIESFACPGRSQ